MCKEPENYVNSGGTLAGLRNILTLVAQVVNIKQDNCIDRTVCHSTDKSLRAVTVPVADASTSNIRFKYGVLQFVYRSFPLYCFEAVTDENLSETLLDKFGDSLVWNRHALRKSPGRTL
ncbi:hypothetical protein Anapl_03229 [Anas platyrhynchos]|uniref:Uncharacterized protein n=1 Tax=Anas platyrhynchos TaxID=8839 RepID=R0JKQ6_ANAPL|nr:hypothetical protein Anapl_03229 [Anas platyrhynchos]